MTRKTGTREWSDVSINCCLGCQHACIYCYARAQANRWGWIADGANWAKESPVALENIAGPLGAKYRRRYSGVVMFPTTHDWTPATRDACFEVLRSLLAAGNRVLVVTKASRQTAQDILGVLSQVPAYQRLEVRVSVGGLDEDTRAFWEPVAPSFGDRIDAMLLLSRNGVHVSASAEPLLEPWMLADLLATLKDAGAASVWVGMLNQIRERTSWLWKDGASVPEKVAVLARYQRDSESVKHVWRQAQPFGDLVHWKDSYREALSLLGLEVNP